AGAVGWDRRTARLGEGSTTLGGQTRNGHCHGVRGTGAAGPVLPADRGDDRARFPGPNPVHAGANRPTWPPVPDVQVPLDGGREATAQRRPTPGYGRTPARPQGAERPASHARRSLSPPHLP